MTVTIFFEGEHDDFINYPYVSAVVDANGDTVATGIVDFFGQIGNTSQDYNINTTLGSIPDTFTASVHFYYDTSYCILPYPCTSTGIDEDFGEAIHAIYPNPASSVVTLNFKEDFTGLKIDLFMSTGECISQFKNVNGRQFRLETEGLQAGLYILSIHNGAKWTSKKFLVE
jgi:hypothetical protein